jgi:hypothetical protein
MMKMRMAVLRGAGRTVNPPSRGTQRWATALARIRSRPKSWWKLSTGATLSDSPNLAACYAASKYLSRTERSSFSEITSLAA